MILTEFRSEIDAAVMRILTAKQAYGLLPCPVDGT